MNEEELNTQAEAYASSVQNITGPEQGFVALAWYDGAKSREEYELRLITENIDKQNKIVFLSRKVQALQKETDRLAQHITELQEDKGRLIDENKEAREIIREWQKKTCIELSDGCCPSCEYCHYGEIKARAKQFLKGEVTK